MDDDDTCNKLSKNTTRLVAISALRRIRTLVDGYEQQNRKNKRNATILIMILIILFSAGIVLMVGNKSESVTLPTVTDSSINHSH